MPVRDPRAEDVERLLAKHNKSLAWLGRQLGVSRQTVHNWISGASAPRDESVWDAMLAKLPKREPEPLGPPRNAAYLPEIRLPLWPALPANGDWDEPQGAEDWIEVPSFLGTTPRSPERVVATIRGDSMSPRLHDGDLVVVELDPSPRTGRIVVARTEDGEVTVKTLLRDKHGDHVLQAVNKEHRVVPKESCVVGYIVAVLRNYGRGRGTIEWDDGGIGP
ncbi:MAG: hypothetical protein KIS66_02495 [Fimbriimonadaceae bacterium]|nr:hypothetical protein [Fimbriimonadaceae bacterium]